MQTAAMSSRFLTASSSIEMLAALQAGSRQGAFYQQLAELLTKGFHTKRAIIEFTSNPSEN